MKKSLVLGFLIFLLITNIIFVSTTVLYKTKIDKQVFKVYSFEGDNNGTAFADEFLLNNGIGDISSEKLFSEDDINIIKDNLYFSLDYSTVDGQTGTSTIKLKVKEFNMNKTK